MYQLSIRGGPARVVAAVVVALLLASILDAGAARPAHALPSKAGLVYVGTECQYHAEAKRLNATDQWRHWTPAKVVTSEDLDTCYTNGELGLYDVWEKPVGWTCGTFKASTVHKGFYNMVDLWAVETTVRACYNGSRVYYRGRPSVRAYPKLIGSEVSTSSCAMEGAPTTKDDAVTGGFSVECVYTYKNTSASVTVGGSVSADLKGIQIGGEAAITIPLGSPMPIYHSVAIYPDGTGEVSGTDGRLHRLLRDGANSAN
jgi:hypothetical protein